MYNYVAVTRGKIENCTELLRIDKNGAIEQYFTKQKEWRAADAGMSGIYSGDIDAETITAAQADEIIKRWGKDAR